MILPARLRKLALTVHVLASVGWLGAVAAFLMLAVTGLAGGDEQLTRAAYMAMEPMARWVLVPLAVAALLTGLVSSLGSPWGLFQHYWVVIKLAVTVVAAVVLLLQLESISHLAEVAARTTLSPTDLRGARASLVVHAGGGLLVLVLPTVLGVFKPRGMTRYGHNRQRAHLAATR